jgi:hypothetical protein
MQKGQHTFNFSPPSYMNKFLLLTLSGHHSQNTSTSVVSDFGKAKKNQEMGRK